MNVCMNVAYPHIQLLIPLSVTALYSAFSFSRALVQLSPPSSGFVKYYTLLLKMERECTTVRWGDLAENCRCRHCCYVYAVGQNPRSHYHIIG